MTLDPVPARLDAYRDAQAREPNPYEKHPTKENEEMSKVKFETNIPQTLIFPFGDFRESEGQYGTDYQYAVLVGGERLSLYATPTLHTHLQTTGLVKGSVRQITKIELPDNKKGWRIVAPEDGVMLHDDAAPPETSPTGPSSVSPPKPNGKPVETTPAVVTSPAAVPNPTIGDLAALMGQCMERALTLWTTLDPDADLPWNPDNVQATANTLFIEANRRGITVPSTPVELPTSPTPTHSAAGARQRLQQRTTATADEPPWASEPAPLPEESPF